MPLLYLGVVSIEIVCFLYIFMLHLSVFTVKFSEVICNVR
jgi:hypothetical protein